MLNVAGPMFALSLLLLGVGILAASNVQEQQRVNADLITREVNAMLAVEELYIVVRDIRHELNLYLRTHDIRNLDNISAFLNSARAPIELTKMLARTETESQLIATVDEGYLEFVKRFDRLMKDVPESERDQQLMQLGNTFLEDRIFEPIRKCIGHNRDIVARTTESGATTAHQMRLGFLLLGITGGIAGLVIGLGIARAITRSFIQLDVSVRSVSGKLRGTGGPVQISHSGNLQGLEISIRQLEDEIGEVVERLQRREMEVLRGEQLAVVGQLAAGVAHELRNPLMPVKMLVQASIEKGPDGALRGDELKIVNEEIQRLEQTIQSFLDFARPPALESHRLDVRDIISRSAELVSVQRMRHHVQLELVLPDTPVYCSVDGPQLRQVLLNLFLNSFDAMPDGGTIRVELNSCSEPSAEVLSLHDAMRVRTFSDSDWVQIVVTDSGRGFPPEMLPRVFEPFVTTKETGTGLGLSICERIISAHGGTIAASNSETSGARFVIRLPCRTDTMPLIRAARLSISAM
jgi:signal transduction histidine kinase